MASGGTVLAAGCDGCSEARTQGAFVSNLDTGVIEDAGLGVSSAARRHRHCFAEPSFAGGSVSRATPNVLRAATALSRSIRE
jgi:hypothetical protein